MEYIKALSKNIGSSAVNLVIYFFLQLKFWDKRKRILLFGTAKRNLKVYFFRKRVENYIQAHRKGECRQCGTCCKFLRSCPFLDGESLCRVHETKHAICRIFPTCQRDVEHITLIDSTKKCGYYFE